ncbi:MAG: glycosyltransferase family 39 protein [Candidatus Moranbacteria bacterium]|nr:glycosyltransferase family 39 protein [Candidatus Moranbacteria bacterium]
MHQKILEIIKNIPKFWWILLAILIVGIFLRTWHHHDWLRFNADQGRDALIVSSAVDGSAPMPLLGPKAGGTQFRLGAAFYYFEIVSAKIFGNVPDKMAYPDLFTGILFIPLLFFFLRKYFEKYVSLYLTAIFAVSAYAIFYARFGWNPNSTPFWTLLFLYAIHEVVSRKGKHKFLWAVLAGVAIGVGVQLHTTLLVILPAVTVLVFGYFLFKKKNVLKFFLIVLAVSLFVNIPQLIDMHKTNGKNITAFFQGLKTKQKAESTVAGNIFQSTSCLVQGNIYIASGYEISDKCSFGSGSSKANVVVFAFGSVFVLGGLVLAVRYFLKEADADQKAFLGIVFVFTGIAYLVFTKMAYELSVRFYLPLVFLPFVLLGLGSNLFFVQKSFAVFANYGNPGGSDVNVTILKEAEEFSRFIVTNASNKKNVYISGDKEFLHKAYTPLKYLVGRSNIKLSLLKNLPLPDQSFQVVRQKNRKKIVLDTGVNILQYKDYGSFSMLLVQKNGSQQ